MNYLAQDKKIEISYLSSGKWDKLDKSGMVFPQLLLLCVKQLGYCTLPFIMGNNFLVTYSIDVSQWEEYVNFDKFYNLKTQPKMLIYKGLHTTDQYVCSMIWFCTVCSGRLNYLR